MGEFPPALAVSDAITKEGIVWRRHLHQRPELAFEEHETSDFIARQLESFGLDVHRGLGETGVIGTLRRGTSARSIGIRADMDALPITELTGMDHASQVPGVMHACGHDGHVAMALVAAKVCSQLSNIDGSVHFIFQPAEEGGGGAKRMIEQGLFNSFPCARIFAIHNQPLLPFGTCVVRNGAMLAALAQFTIEIVGEGCHAARPHQGKDAIFAGCQIVTALQSIISRNTDPLETGVVSVTKINAGNSFGVLPENCLICGTARWFDEATGDLIEQRLRTISVAIAEGFGCTATVTVDRRNAATINDAKSAEFVRALASKIDGLTVEEHPPSTGSEDFSEMLRLVPGCQIWLGGGRAVNDAGLHSPRYDFNDALIAKGALLWVSIVLESLSA
ncbi:MAG: M20 aminoacylase family protein [Sphingobium sp.]